MRPDVRIEPQPDDPDAGGGGASPADLLTALQEVRAVGTDAGGNTAVTLDGAGRLVEFSVAGVVVDGGRREVERAVTEAFAAAFDELQARREEQARAALASGPLQVAGITADLQRLGDEADARLREVFERLERNAARLTGSS